MNPNVWGKYQWTAIHFSALGYPWNPSPTIKKNFRTFFMEILPSILPCESCRNHLSQTLSQHPITDKDLENSETLFQWTVNLHNTVNKRLGKPTLSLTEAKAIYSNVDNLRNAIDKKQSNITPSTPVSITIIDSKISENSLQYILLTFMFIFILVLYVYFMKFNRRFRR